MRSLKEGSVISRVQWFSGSVDGGHLDREREVSRPSRPFVVFVFQNLYRWRFVGGGGDVLVWGRENH